MRLPTAPGRRSSPEGLPSPPGPVLNSIQERAGGEGSKAHRLAHRLFRTHDGSDPPQPASTVDPWPPRGGEAGSALVVVLVVLTLFLVVSAVVAGVVTEQHRYVQRSLDQTQARYAAEAGVHMAMARLEDEPAWRPALDTMTLPGGLTARVTVRPHGGFYEVESVADVRARRSGARAVVGAVHPLLENAVVLGDASTALHVAGSTAITGPIVLGPRGLQRGMQRGSAFRGRIEGPIENGGHEPLPDFDPALIEAQLARLDAALDAPPEEAIGGADGSTRHGPALVWIAESAVLGGADSEGWTATVTVLANGNLELARGFAVPPGSRIAARGLIHIGEDVGEHVGIVYSRRNVLVRGGRFSGQLFARDSVRVEGGAYLRYPSLLYVSGRVVGTERHATIWIAEGATVDGTLVYPSLGAQGRQDRGRITVEPGALMRGAVFSAGQTHAGGTVHGSVLTHRFYHYASPQTLINWLVDATISHPDRPGSFRMPVGLEGDARLEVLSWEEFRPAATDEREEGRIDS